MRTANIKERKVKALPKRKNIFCLLILFFLCCILANCSLNLSLLNKPRVNYFSKDNIININYRKIIELDLNQIQFTDWKVEAEYSVVGGKIKKKELIGKNLILDQLGMTSISLDEKKINWIKYGFTMYEFGGGIVEDNLICSKGFSGDIYCLNIYSGEPKWVYRKTDYLKRNPESKSTPRIKYFDSKVVILENCLGPSLIPIQAISTKTGEKIWEHEVKIWGNFPELKATSILFVNEKIAILEEKEHLIGIDTYTGKEVWKIETKDFLSSFSLIESNQFFELTNRFLFCLSGKRDLRDYGYLVDLARGHIIRKSINCTRNIHVNNDSLYSQKLTDNKMYVLGSDDNGTLSIICIDLSRMQEEWRTVIGHSAEINKIISKFYFFPEIKDKIFLLLNFPKSIFNSSYPDKQDEAIDGLYCFNKDSGLIEWINPNCNTSISIEYKNSKVFYYKERIDLPFPREVECFDLKSRKILWNLQIPKDFINDIGFIDNNVLINVRQNFFILVEAQTGRVLKAFPSVETSSSFSYIKFFDKIEDYVLFECYKKERNDNDIPEIIEVNLNESDKL